MKEHPVNRSADQLTLVAMATSARVLGRVAAAWESPGLFSSSDLNLLGDLAVRHYRKHLKPPSRDGLGDALVRWAARHPGLVDKAAQAESTYQGLPWGAKVPAAHATEAALEVFRRAREQQFADEHQAALLRGDLDGAEKLRREFKPVELLPSQGISLSDAEAWRAAFPDEGPEVLVSFTHGLRLFFGDLLQRETFFTFVAPEKRGKSWWLLHVAWNALMQGRRVVYFEAGDMTQAQVFRRLASRAARRPWGPGTARVPIAVKADGYDPEDARVTGTREERFEGFLTAKAGHKAYLDLLKAKVKTKGDPFRLYCFPTGTLAVDQVRQVLRDEKAEGRPADVVVIDYADILAMPTGRMEYRDRIGEVWKQLRGLSMSEHVCLFTATQGNRESYGQKLLLMKHIGEDKRKLSFVNGAVGINVWGREKGQGRCRLNWLCGRDVPASEWQVVHCAGALELANPAIRSVFLKPEECTQRKKDGGD